MAQSKQVGFEGYSRCAPFSSYEQWLACQSIRAKNGFVQVCYPCRSAVNAATEEDLRSKCKAHFHKSHTIVQGESCCTICLKGTGPHGENDQFLIQHAGSNAHRKAMANPKPTVCLTCGTVNPLANHNPDHDVEDFVSALNHAPVQQENGPQSVSGPELLLLLNASKNYGKFATKGPCRKHLEEILPQGFQQLKVTVSEPQNAMSCNICRLQVKMGVKDRAETAVLLVIDPPAMFQKKKPTLKSVLRMSELEKLGDEEYDLYDLNKPKRGMATLNDERFRLYMGGQDEDDSEPIREPEDEETQAADEATPEAKADPSSQATATPRTGVDRYSLPAGPSKPAIL